MGLFSALAKSTPQRLSLTLVSVENLIAPPPLDRSVAAPVAETVEPVPCSVPAVVALLSETFIPEAPAKPAFKPPTLAVKIVLKAYYSNVADEQGMGHAGAVVVLHSRQSFGF